MKNLNFVYKIGDKDYNVYVTFKRQRNIYFRLKEDGFHVSASTWVRKSDILKGLDKFAEKLIKRKERKVHYSFEEDFVYLLGEKVSISSLNINNIDELNTFLKQLALSEITNLVRKYEQIMNINRPYKVHVRNTKNQFGSNSKATHSLSFQIALIHYSREIIETVVVHELAHDRVRNHQKEFYDVVFKYSPNYHLLQRKLKKGIHS